MKLHEESDMVKGWFVGNFIPSAYTSKNFEVCLKRYKAGDHESKHVHRIATEITFIVEGLASMNSARLKKGSIIVIEPGEATDFLAVKDTITVVVKSPSIIGDKYDSDSPQGQHKRA